MLSRGLVRSNLTKLNRFAKIRWPHNEYCHYYTTSHDSYLYRCRYSIGNGRTDLIRMWIVWTITNFNGFIVFPGLVNRALRKHGVNSLNSGKSYQVSNIHGYYFAKNAQAWVVAAGIIFFFFFCGHSLFFPYCFMQTERTCFRAIYCVYPQHAWSPLKRVNGTLGDHLSRFSFTVSSFRSNRSASFGPVWIPTSAIWGSRSRLVQT